MIEPILLQMRLLLYPACALGFLLLAVFVREPLEQRRISRVLSFQYASLSMVFSMLGVAVFLRLAVSDAFFLRVTNYLVTPPLILTFVVILLSLWQAGRTYKRVQ